MAVILFIAFLSLCLGALIYKSLSLYLEAGTYKKLYESAERDNKILRDTLKEHSEFYESLTQAHFAKNKAKVSDKILDADILD